LSEDQRESNRSQQKNSATSNKTIEKYTQAKRDMEKYRSRLAIKGTECEHQKKLIKILNKDYSKKVKSLEEEIEALQEQNMAQKKMAITSMRLSSTQ